MPLSTPQVSILRVEDIDSEIESFRTFLRLKKNLAKKSASDHCNTVRRFLSSYLGVISEETVDAYLQRVKEQWTIKTYANHLCSFKRYLRDFKQSDLVDNYEFPDIKLEPIMVPSREELARFFEALPSATLGRNNRRIDEPKYKALFLLLASSGLRLGEALSLTKKGILTRDRMVIPSIHEANSTKNSWVTFYNRETEEYLTWLETLHDEEKVFPPDMSVYAAFNLARDASGVGVTPQRLREWFCEEMGNLGVPDRYVDAFCGRLPKSVLARRYTDYSPEKLRTVYEKANLRVGLVTFSGNVVATA